MRILLAGAHQVLGQALLKRLGPDHEILALVKGSPLGFDVPTADIDPMSPEALCRYMLGCQALIHLVGPGTDGVEAAATAAGVGHIIRVASWTDEGGAQPHRCTLRLGELIGPGDPHEVGAAWMRWALHQSHPGPGRAVLVDHRDAVGGIESALWKGRAGAVYPIVGANPTWVELADLLQAVCSRPAPPDAAPCDRPREDAGQVDLSLSVQDLGWWHRSLEQSLKETVAAL